MDYNRSLFNKLCYRYPPNCSFVLREHMDYVYSEKIKRPQKKNLKIATDKQLSINKKWKCSVQKRGKIQ